MGASGAGHTCEATTAAYLRAGEGDGRMVVGGPPDGAVIRIGQRRAGAGAPNRPGDRVH